MTMSCCEYQRKLITKFAQTKYFNDLNIIQFQESIGIPVNSGDRFNNTNVVNRDLLTDDEDDANYEKYVKKRADRNKQTANLLYQNVNSFEEPEDNSIRFQFRFKNFIELELTTNDMTELNVDGVVNLMKCDLEILSYDSKFFFFIHLCI
jgi:hypothetical protein